MLPGAWSVLRNTGPCAGLIHSGAGAASADVGSCAGSSLARHWLVLGDRPPPCHPWVPSLVRSRNTALSVLDPWAFLPSLPPSLPLPPSLQTPLLPKELLVQWWGLGLPRYCGTKSSRRSRRRLAVSSVGGGKAAGPVWVASEPTAGCRWGPLLGCSEVARYWAASSAGASWPRAGEPVRRSWALAPVGLSFPSKAGVAITLRAQASLFFLIPAHESPRTPSFYLSSRQPRIQEFWMDPVENTIRSYDVSGQALKVTLKCGKS